MLHIKATNPPERTWYIKFLLKINEKQTFIGFSNGMVGGSSVLDTLEIESVHHIDVKSQQIQCYQKTDLLTGMQHCMQQINPARDITTLSPKTWYAV